MVCGGGVNATTEEVGGSQKTQSCGTGSLLTPLHGFWGSNLGYQACMASAFTCEPSGCPQFHFYYLIIYLF